MTEISNSKQYDLVERTLRFAKECREFVKRLPRTIGNIEDGKQLIRSSGSVHANYIEANEALSKKDFYHRLKICRKESKESRSWLELVDIEQDKNLENKKQSLSQESTEFIKIFSSILKNES